MPNPVLVVQDNQTTLNELAALLRQRNYEVLVASDGEEGWAIFSGQIAERMPGTVVSAIRMPNLDGVSLLKRIKNKAPATKVILTSSMEHPYGEQDALSLGAVIVPHPIQDLDAFLRLLES